MKKVLFSIFTLIILLGGVVSIVAAENQELSELDILARKNDPDPQKQDFIVIDNPKTKAKTLAVKEILSSEDYSQINSTMYGIWGIFQINGEYVFCINPGYDTLSIAQKVDADQISYGKFSAKSKTYLGRVSAIAKQLYADSGNDDYIYAGQLLMWEYISEHELDVVGNPMQSWNPLYMESWTIRNASSYKSEIAEIEQNEQEYDVIPSFMGTSSKPKTHTLLYNPSSKKFELTLTDENGVWDSRYAKYGSFGDYQLSNPSGKNNLKITTTKENLDPSSGYKLTYKLGASNEYYDAGQDLVILGGDEVSASMKFKTEKEPLGGFIIKKVDEETSQPLAGVKYSLYDDNQNLVAKYITDSNGLISSGKTLSPGHYNLVETEALEGYVLPSGKVSSVTIKADHIQDYSSNVKTNRKIKGGFELSKMGSNVNGEKQPLKNVEFTVSNVDDSSFEKKYYTDQNGLIKTAANELEYGTYIIKETGKIPGYVGEFEQQFTISQDGEIVSLNEGESIINEEYWKQIEFKKVGQSLEMDNDQMLGLEGVEFELYKEGGEANQMIDEQDELIEVLISDAAGNVVSPPLTIGDYILTESKPKFGYRNGEQDVSFKISVDSSNHQVINLGEYKNELEYGSAYLYKNSQSECTEEEEKRTCESPLSDVEFGIYQDINSNKEIDDEDIFVDTLITGDNGYGEINNLKYGNYLLKETSSPYQNYYQTDSVYEFNITSNEIVAINGGEPIINVEKMGQVEIEKISQETGVPLEDATFGLYNQDNQLIQELKTDNEGKAVSNSLSFGSYYIQEMSAPKGYSRDLTEYGFEINEQTYQKSQVLTVTNSLLTNDIIVSKIDYGTKELIAGAKLEIINRETKEVIDSWESLTEAHVATLPYGKYELHEIAAPEGYKQTSKVEKFQVTEEGVVQEFSISNIKMTELVATGKKVGTFIASILFVIIVLLAIFKYRNYKK